MSNAGASVRKGLEQAISYRRGGSTKAYRVHEPPHVDVRASCREGSARLLTLFTAIGYASGVRSMQRSFTFSIGTPFASYWWGYGSATEGAAACV